MVTRNDSGGCKLKKNEEISKETLIHEDCALSKREHEVSSEVQKEEIKKKCNGY